jgi:hypothetical protein
MISLDEEAQLFVPDIEQIYSSKQVTRTQNALIAARGDYKRQIIRGCRDIGGDDPLRAYIDGTQLALVKRECTATLCPGLDVPANSALGDTLSEGERRERVFEAIFYWALSKKVDLPLNQPLLLDFSDTGGLAPKIVEVRAGIQWPNRLPPADVQAYFEFGAKQVLDDSSLPALSSTISAQMSIPKSTVLRSTYAFRNASDAWALAVDGAEFQLKLLQDETARIQLSECKIYRGLPELHEIARCAGYDINETELLDCLSGGSCMPRMAAKADVGATLLAARRSVEELKDDSFIPRPYTTAAGSFEKLVDSYKTCASGNGLNVTSAECLVYQLTPPELLEQNKCLLEVIDTDPLSCLSLDDEATASLKQMEKCISEGGSRCVMEAALPPEWSCVARAQSPDDLDCLATSVGGDAARVALCFEREPDTANRLLCLGGEQIPPQARALIGCYASATSESGALACAVSTSLPPEQAALLKCAVESGGDPIAAGVCVAAPRLGLNPGQQIILQCAAAAGGEPTTAATCIVGRFTLAELQGCRNAEFGESGCFGENNEFQKLSVALTGSRISKDSVVGQIAIFHIERANAVILGVGHAAGQLSNGVDNTVKGFGRSLENLRKNPVQEIANAPDNIRKEGEKALERVGEALNPRNWKIRL